MEEMGISLVVQLGNLRLRSVLMSTRGGFVSPLGIFMHSASQKRTCQWWEVKYGLVSFRY